MVLAVTPLLLAGGVVTQLAFTVQTQQSVALQREIARQLANRLEEYAQNLDSELRLASEIVGLSSAPADKREKALQTLLTFGSKPFVSLVLLDMEGKELARADTGAGGLRVSASDELFLVPRNQGRVFFGPVRLDPASPVPLASMAQPLYGPGGGAVQGALVAEVKLLRLAELVRGANSQGAGETYILDSAGRLLAHRDHELVKAGIGRSTPLTEGLDRGLDGRMAAVASGQAKIGGQTLHVVTERNVTQALGLAVDTLWGLIVLVLASSAAATFLAYFVIRRIVRPIDQLAETVRAATGGDLSQRAVESEDEVGQLGKAFNAMTTELECTMRGLEEKIKELTKTQAKLQESERRYRELFEFSSEGIALCTLDGVVREANPKAHWCLGYTPDEAVGLTSADVTLPEDVSADKDAGMRTALLSGQTLQFERRLKHKQGKLITAELFVKRIGEDLMQVMFRDITQRKRMEAELLKAKTAAEEASRAKGQFLANMSHEIRTPLSCIIGMSELTLESDPRPDQKENLEMILDSAVSLLDIINDILDYTKIEANKLTLSNRDFNLRKTLEKTIKAFATQATRKGDTLHFEIHNEVPAVVKGDAGRLAQIIRNLVGNAVKFTENGSIKLSVSNATPGVWPATLSFSVRDTGIGIPLDKLDQLFQIFSQVDSSYSKKYSGTGLGLAISKELVGMMGGQIWVQSEKGVGSSFAFTAVFGAPEQLPAESGPARKAIDPYLARHPRRVLFAEDNKINRLFISDFLSRAGHAVVGVGNGLEALEALEAEPFDLILMDIQMPELDGVEAARRIRSGAVPGADPNIPIIALTAYAMKEDKERFFAAGINGCITKPVERAGLLKTLDDFYEANLNKIAN
jgi:PAS domain S-box-containing protein